MRASLALLVLASTLSFGAVTANADIAATLQFFSISNNDSGDVDTGSMQVGVDVGNDIGFRTNQVRFTFHNVGPEPCSITDVYFDDGSLLGIAVIENTPGLVEFSQNATPGNLPAANNAVPPFEATEGFSADSDPPIEPLGVGPGESLGIIFDLQNDKTIPDVVADLTSGALRVGLHVQGFAGGGSESFVNFPVPEPASGLLLAAATFALFRRPR